MPRVVSDWADHYDCVASLVGLARAGHVNGNAIRGKVVRSSELPDISLPVPLLKVRSDIGTCPERDYGGHMVEGVPSGFSEGPSAQPPAGSWPPPNLGQPASRQRPWMAIAVAVTGAVAAVALSIALTRPAPSHPAVATATPTRTSTEIAMAQQRLCETYKLAARAVQVDTNGSNKAFARIAPTNSAVLLYNASNDPALDEQHRSAAPALATAYLTDTAKSSEGAATEAEFQDAVADVNAKDAAMKKVCGGG